MRHPARLGMQHTFSSIHRKVVHEEDLTGDFLQARIALFGLYFRFSSVSCCPYVGTKEGSVYVFTKDQATSEPTYFTRPCIWQCVTNGNNRPVESRPLQGKLS